MLSHRIFAFVDIQQNEGVEQLHQYYNTHQYDGVSRRCHSIKRARHRKLVDQVIADGYLVSAQPYLLLLSPVTGVSFKVSASRSCHYCISLLSSAKSVMFLDCRVPGYIASTTLSSPAVTFSFFFAAGEDILIITRRGKRYEPFSWRNTSLQNLFQPILPRNNDGWQYTTVNVDLSVDWSKCGRYDCYASEEPMLGDDNPLKKFSVIWISQRVPQRRSSHNTKPYGITFSKVCCSNVTFECPRTDCLCAQDGMRKLPRHVPLVGPVLLEFPV
ncbi:hypothetical protein NPIL_409751 [Nephila pilipes]|uniref:Uncharacterized protein n=1 Tax=Nephila pilipes TaxID=299642 RepID=A0A8X6NVZ6_NEPPI|nr:hypothetical protein NPIL_409751 [Nephila pilipes]